MKRGRTPSARQARAEAELSDQTAGPEAPRRTPTPDRPAYESGRSGTLYTVGHSTRSFQEFVSLLRAAGVEAVADVRALPSSRRHPQFNSGALKASLGAEGIEYEHFPQLGGRRQPLPDSVNTGWRESAFRGYADHMYSSEFAEGVARLAELATKKTTAVMCAEAVWWRCHRRLIADALTARGWRVLHLGVGQREAVHVLPPFAVVEAHQVAYPSPQTSLLD